MAVRLKNIATVKRFIAEGYVRPTLLCEFLPLALEVEMEMVATMTVATMVTVAAVAVEAAVAIHRSLCAVSHHRAAAVHHQRRARVHSATPPLRWRWWCP